MGQGNPLGKNWFRGVVLLRFHTRSTGPPLVHNFRALRAVFMDAPPLPQGMFQAW